jgi:hypothetical protein
MGAWGEASFHNDSACDWTAGFAEAGNFEQVAETLREAAQPPGVYLDADVCCEALAACEVVARLKGQWGERDAYSEAVDAWVVGNPREVPGAVTALALAAIDRITGEDSELAALWREGEDGGAQWIAAVADLRRRVAAAPALEGGL